MAGDWIKMRAELLTHPRFVCLCSHLIHGEGADGFLPYVCGDDALSLGALPLSHESVTERALRCVTERALRDVALSLLLRLWCAVNAHCKVHGSDAVMTPMDTDQVDDVVGCRLFGASLLSVGWIVEDSPNSLIFPNFLEHNQPACLRRTPLSNAERQRRHRERKASVKPRVTKSNESNAREEKRREEFPPNPPEGGSGEPATPASPPPPPAAPAVGVLTFPCSGKPDAWTLTAEQVDAWRDLFPGVEVLGECRKALAWEVANPTRRKTARGHPRFLVGWLARAQNQGPAGGRGPPGGRRETVAEIVDRVLGE